MGWAPDFQKAQEDILAAPSAELAAPLLRQWLSRSQPCLFGRAAAKFGTLDVRIVDQDTLLANDAEIRSLLFQIRLEWTRSTWSGGSSGLVILFRGRSLAEAAPGAEVLALSKRLASFFLDQSVEVDTICHADAYLEVPGRSPPRTLRWLAGVNYFSAAGDRRWWQDHRIPAGIAFSINSVGHLVKAGRLMKALSAFYEAMGEKRGDDMPDAAWLESLPAALKIAMQTIEGASRPEDGPAVELVPLRLDTISRVGECPIELPRRMAGKDFETYRGWYHTDVTLPTDYFRVDVRRPADVKSVDLNLSYLFHRDIENPDFDLMGEGRPIRAEDDADGAWARASARLARAVPSEAEVAEFPLLVQALKSTSPPTK